MPRVRHHGWDAGRPDIVRRLQDELDSARWAIIELMPEAARRLLHGYVSCDSRTETHLWREKVAEEIVALAEIIAGTDDGFGPARAYCPLCRRGSTTPYERGFSVPEGLRRHLLGWGDTHQCDVMKAVLALARDHWEQKFRASEEAEEERKQREIAGRRKVETLYRVIPDGEPQLIDEGLLFETPRDAEGLVWAEHRLAELGYSDVSNGNIKSYVSEHGAFAAFADPRRKGEIRFVVYKRPVPTKARGRPRHAYVGSFVLMDSWKHDIRQKYQSRLNRLINK